MDTSARKERFLLAYACLRVDSIALTLIGSHHWHKEGFRLRLVTNEKSASLHVKDGMILLLFERF